MKVRFLTPIFTLMILLFCTIVTAESIQQNWQLAYKNDVTSFYFDTNTVKTVDSPDILNADLKIELSKIATQELANKYKDKYDTKNWNKIKYEITSTVYNQTSKTAVSKNHRFFDSSNNLIVAIDTEEKVVVPANSTESKIYTAIFEWLYEN
ncbi:MAG: hypothetical protein H6Q70_3625 [Firmicutes bacterium]|nr:hypothetical protein [Bacillota bacterium]